MHEVMIRFRFVSRNQTMECSLDERLSLNDNFLLLKQIGDLRAETCEIYDPRKKIFLNKDIPLREFTISHFILLYVFE